MTDAELRYLIAVNDRDVREAKRNLDAMNKALGKDTPAAADSAGSSFDGASHAMGGFNVALGDGVHQTSLFQGSLGAIKWPSFIAGAGLAAQGAGALAAGAIGLVAALAPAAGAIAAYPALALAFFQAMGVAKLALEGVGEALTADKKKLEELLKTMPPAKREFVLFARENVMPLKAELAELASGAIFPGITRGIKAAFNPANIAAVKGIVESTASVLGGLGAKLGQELGDPQWARDLAVVGERNARWVNDLGSAAIEHMLPALRDLIVVAGPLVDWLVSLGARLGEWIGNAVAAGRETGALTGFFERTREVLTLLGGILKPIGILFWEIGKAAAPLGREILRALNVEAAKLAEWAQSEGGRQTLRQYFESAKPLIWEVGRLLRDVTGSFLRLSQGDPGKGGLVRFIQRLRTEVLPLFEGVIASTTEQFGPAIQDTLIEVLRLFATLAGSNGPLTVFVETLGKFAGGLADLLENNPMLQEFVFTLGGFAAVFKVIKFTAMITGLTSMFGLMTNLVPVTRGATGATWGLNAAMRANPIGLIVTALQLLAAGLFFAWTQSETFRNVVTAVFDVVKKVVGGAIDFIAGIVKNLPLIWLITHIGDVKDAVTGAIDAIVGFFSGLPGRVWNAIQDLASGAYGWVKEQLRLAVVFYGQKLDELVGFFKGLPGRVWGAIQELASGAYGWLKEQLRLAVVFYGQKLDDLVGFFRSIPGRIAELGESFINAARTLGGKLKAGAVDGVTGIVSSVWEIINNIPGFLKDKLGTVLEWGRDLGGAILRGIARGLAGIGDVILGALRAGWNRFVDWWNTLKVTINIPDKIPGLPDKWVIDFPDLAHLAAGGIINAPTLALLGESGAEAVVPLDSYAGRRELTVVVTAALRDVLGDVGGGFRGPAMHVENLNVNDRIDGELVAAAISRRLAIRSRR